MRFMMLMIPKGYESAKPGTMPDAKHVEEMMKYNDSLQKAGILVSMDGLHPPSMGARVSFNGGKGKVTDGPFPETKEVLGGYWIINVKSKAEAVEWASRCPAWGNEVIEVRQVQEMSDFPEDIKQEVEKYPDLQKKETPKQNPVRWFEIPTKNIERARKFYESVFGFQIAPPMDVFGSKISFFPMEMHAVGSGGALVQSENAKSSTDGVVIYFGVKAIDTILAAVEKAGGKTLIPRTNIGEYGFFAHLSDTEGNRIGIHEHTGDCKG